MVTSQKVKVDLNFWKALMGQRDSLNKGIQPFPARPNAHQLKALEAGVKRVPLPHIIDIWKDHPCPGLFEKLR